VARQQAEIDVLDVPIYSVPAAGRFVGLNAARVRRWLKGYAFPYSDRQGGERWGHSPPVVPGHEYEGRLYASFLHLMDLLFVREFLARGLSLQRIRKLLDEVREVTAAPHFARRRLFARGQSVFLRLEAELEHHSGGYLELGSGGQLAIPKFVEMIGKQIDFSATSNWAERWYPPGHSRIIVLDPKVSFGSPTIAGHRITTSTVHEAYLAEDQDVKAVCDWMIVAPREVRAAVKFEQSLATAA
jgi:uncharacterized protein (DUF433 family)/DNA-binding transcriptional MerR regulator